MHGPVSMVRGGQEGHLKEQTDLNRKAGGNVGCPGWRKEYGTSQRDSPLSRDVQGEKAVMSGGLQRTSMF